ncbi:MAG: PD40 domain-containing protein, partial [Kiritimatiellae bacterium]|nr:PD40 domain-containing protein [Kiritimatiellia bacterium]
MSRCHLAVVVLTAATLAAPTAPTQDTPKRPMTVEDLWAMGRLADPELAPDGRAVAFAVTEYDMDRNRGATSIHLVPREGGPARRLTAPVHSAAQPRFAPDGKFLYFLSARGGPTQVWR